MKAAALLAIWLGLLGTCTAYADARRYDAVFTVEFDPAAGVGRASIRITPDTGRVSQLDLRMPAARYTHIAGDGSVSRSGDRVLWRPPKTGGELR
ncbi:MAG: hypothetical protein EHM84_05380, partial [Lysobacterales bacterium]